MKNENIVSEFTFCLTSVQILIAKAIQKYTLGKKNFPSMVLENCSQFDENETISLFLILHETQLQTVTST